MSNVRLGPLLLLPTSHGRDDLLDVEACDQVLIYVAQLVNFADRACFFEEPRPPILSRVVAIEKNISSLKQRSFMRVLTASLVSVVSGSPATGMNQFRQSNLQTETPFGFDPFSRTLLDKICARLDGLFSVSGRRGERREARDEKPKVARPGLETSRTDGRKWRLKTIVSAPV
ncbi:unnamed protein product [Protopolystoma xenopodis]|uniref:Uncharacterized protein n=1 Tax=Protopolystoma xenopodis TaxID=117903 RepID=A0A3S5CMK5_9PLAT|nr:unnamed protein product [Protopolystoma xenopodis]